MISLSIGLILRLFVSEVDDSAVKGYGSKVSLVNPSFTGNISAHSMPTYRSVPALARGAVIPPNRDVLGRVVYQLNKAEGNRIGVSLTGV